jgi:dTDP-4-amino-4,6-dideoxygalactose transaminase
LSDLPPIPVLDLGRAQRRIRQDLDRRWSSLLERTAFIGGSEVEEFEHSWARYLDAAYCVGVANGTDALQLALRALGLEPGDEVIVPAFTFIATASTVSLLGGTPVFADVEPETLNLDLEDAARRISPRTVGIIGVHLYGRPFDLDRALALCRDNGLWLLEDAAQAHGARWRGRRVGGFGRLATWSFYPAKNLGCFGDGGAVTAAEPELETRLRKLANHGRAEHYLHDLIGSNSRLDALQAAVLSCRLERLEEDNRRRREIACRYHELLSGVGDLRLLQDPEGAESVYHQMTVRSARRDDLREHLAERGIASAVHYPMPLHLQPAFEYLPSPEGGLPECEAAAREVLCLPMFPELEEGELERVGAAVRDYFGVAG